MPEAFDVTTPSPDEGHEAIRIAVLRAINDGVGNADEAYFLTDVLFELLDGVMAANADLTVRVKRLEQWRADMTSASKDILTVTEVRSGVSVGGLGAGVVIGWTWTRTATNGQVIARGDTYTREADAWRGAQRANPDL